jgi:hypothetical protein
LASVERIKELLPHLHGHAAQRRCELVRRAQPPAMMIAVDAASGIAVAFWLVAGSTADAAVKGKALRRAGVLAGILAGPFFLGFGRIEHVGQLWLSPSAWLGIRGRRAGFVA